MTRSGKRPLTIGVAGGSGSGKTTVASNILELAGRGNVAHLCHDSYYYDQGHLSIEERSAINYDHPASLDNVLFVEHLKDLQHNQPVRAPVYDFTHHTRFSEPRIIEPRRVILVEGILILAIPEIRRLLDIRVFVDTDADIRFIRRLKRDITERLRTPQSVIDQYLATVRPMQLEFVEPSKKYANIVVPEGGMNEVAIDILHAKIQSVIKKATGPLVNEVMTRWPARAPD
ncbi:MAG: uridine kinase [Cyanobacteria bacterium NC_groundwater_1444_Ag_S-0.65um_54_12]|nr:uridine kinase [Cyanobacteria bacterium NC_groundwater_1444_Ag_S-0.65um_54_12]